MKKISKVSLICFYNPIKNKILLQDRLTYSKNWEDWAFFWWWIELWETPLEAFFREAKEELDLDMKKFDYKYLWEYIFEYPERIVCRNLYFIETKLETLDFTVLEWAWAKYFTINEARDLKFPTPVWGFLDIVEEYINSKNLIL